jgi:L-fucose isomerase
MVIRQDSPHNRLIGDMPKIGIRPTIDGRRNGVRESLESQTMEMAQSVGQFISNNLRHSNGLPVECVIADNCIGGIAEAAQTAAKFGREGVGVSITVTRCWCYGAETIDMDPCMPKAIWGFNGTERPGAVYLASALAAHNQKGFPAFGIYGRDVQDMGDTAIPRDVQAKLLQFTRAALAAATMRGKSYLAIGGVSMGIAGSIVDHSFFENYLGMRVQTVDMSEYIRRTTEGIFDKEEFDRALKWVKKNCREGIDYNPIKIQRNRAQKQSDWETSVKMAMITRDMMAGNPRLADIGFIEESLGYNAIVSGFQGQRQWTDHFANGDFMEAILNSSFDWNAIREPYIVATENDSLNGAGMLFGHLLTNTAQLFADVRTYWSPEALQRAAGYTPIGCAEGGIIHLINSGAASLDYTGQQSVMGKPAVKPFWEINATDSERCLKATTWYPARLDSFRGGGYSSGFLTRGDLPLTMSRINLVKGLGPVLQIAEGYSVTLPESVHQVLNERTDPTWPTTWFAPILTGSGAFRDVYSVMNNWGANHASISYGHIGHELITLAAMLRIPVCMHNVKHERIFRPTAWAALGDAESQGADYRACANFGPIYG